MAKASHKKFLASTHQEFVFCCGFRRKDRNGNLEAQIVGDIEACYRRVQTFKHY
jgi:hypothetical protein